jgi:hypothetical protein
MKAITLWNSPNIGATNESGFTGLPGAAVPTTLGFLAPPLMNGAIFGVPCSTKLTPRSTMLTKLG